MKRFWFGILGFVLLTLSPPCFGEINNVVLNSKYQNEFYVQVSSEATQDEPYSFLKTFIDIKGSRPVGVLRVIGFYPSDKFKNTIVKYEEFEMFNITKTSDSIQFDVLLTGSWDHKPRRMKIVITNINDESPYNDSLEGKSFFYSESTKETDSIHWKSTTDGFFTLKYPKVL